MNLKSKIISVVMSFTIICSSCFNTFATSKNAFVVSAPMVAVVSSIAVACGVSLNDNTDLYDVVSIFYNKYKDNQEMINSAFDLGVSIMANKVVSVSKEFVELVKSAFDDYSINSDYSDSIHIDGFGLSSPVEIVGNSSEYISVHQGPYTLKYNKSGVEVLLDGNRLSYIKTTLNGTYYAFDFVKLAINEDGKLALKFWHKESSLTDVAFMECTVQPSINAFPSFKEYDFDKIADKVEQGSLGLHMPGYLGDLIGKKPSDVVSDGVNANPYDKPYDDVITLPGVDNPSIDSSLEGSFNPSLDTDVPGTSNPSVPSEGIWSTIKDFIISLVVPSDTFWTDTFNGFRDNFTKNFPMVDMSRFDELVVGGKPFPNIYAYGSKIVDGDVINSFVDWLRPIIAGFIMICLMFFNYRKIYKLIRNSEPFGSIAQGSSEFRTGLTPSDPNPYGNLRDSLWEMRNEILRRERGK